MEGVYVKLAEKMFNNSRTGWRVPELAKGVEAAIARPSQA